MKRSTLRPISAAGVITTGLALVGAMLTGPASNAATSAATTTSFVDEVTTTVQFAGCEVRYEPYGANTRIGGESVWSPSLTFNHPTPIPAGEEITTSVQMGDLPANVLPEDLHDVHASVGYLEFQSEHLYPLRFYNEFYVPTLDATQPLSFPEWEYDTDYADVGTYNHRVKSIALLFTGKNSADEFAEYSFECDKVVNPQQVLTTSVYDLSLAPSLTAAPLATRQGRVIRLTGANLLVSAPTDPAAQVNVTIGGISVGSYPLDASGALIADVTVPAYLKPGERVVQVTNGAKTVTTTITVKVVKAKLTAAPKSVKANKSVTITGTKFQPSEKVRLVLKGGKKKGKKSFKKTVTADALGQVTAKIKLKKAARGKWKVTAIGTSSARPGKTKFKVR